MRTGQDQGMVCPGCQTPHVPTAAFCGHCGRKLATSGQHARRAADQSPLTLLAVYWPDAFSIHEAAHVLGLWGGTMEASLDGRILASFGRPHPREDDLRRAAAAALDLMARKSRCEIGEPKAYLVNGSLPRVSTSIADTPLGREALLALDRVLDGRIGMPARTARLVEANFDTRQDDAGDIHWLEPGQRRLDPDRVATLHGRQAERRKIEGMVTACIAGHPQLWIVTGPEGSGKSRLVVEAQAQTNREALSRLILIRVHSLSPDRNYGLVRDLIHQILAAPDTGSPWPSAAAFGKQWPDAHAEFLWPILRNLAQLESPSPEQVQQVLPHLTRFLWEATRHRPLLLAVDNLEWTDALSWSWWQQFLQATPSSGHRLWIILTSTQRFILPETGLDLTVTNLQPLPEAESLSCLASALGLDQGQETWPAEILPVLREGVRHAGGNPLFLRELAFDLLATGTVTYGPAGWRARERAPGETLVPESLSALLRAKEARLPPAARQTLATAAVIGSRFAWDDLGDLVGREVLPEILQTLVDAGLLAVEGHEVCFRQEALRTLTAASMSEDQRQTVRRQLANRLMTRQQEQMEELDGRIADLLEEGGALDEAASWAQKAMALATDRQEPGEALRRAHQILRLAKTLPETAPEDLERATQDVASLELQVGSVAEAERLWQTLHDMAPITKRHEARTQLARIAGMRGDFDQALAFAEEGLAVAELLGEAGNQIRFLIELGLLATRQERWDIAESACKRVRSLIPPDSQQKDAGDMLVLEGKLQLRAGRHAEALAAGRAALDLYEAHRESDAMAEAFQLIAWAHRASGNATQAQRSLRQAMQSARDTTVARELALMLANFALEEGDTPTVLELDDDWLQAAGAGRLGKEHLLLGSAWLFAGMRDLVRIHLEGPFEGRPDDLAVLHAIQAINKSESDDMAGARLAVRHALQQATAAEGSTTLARALAQGAAGHVAFVAGDYETAVRHLREARTVLPTPAHPVWSLWFDIVYGISLQTLGSPLPFLPEDLSVRASQVRLPMTLEPYWTMLRSELSSVVEDGPEPFDAWDASMPAWTIGND